MHHSRLLIKKTKIVRGSLFSNPLLSSFVHFHFLLLNLNKIAYSIIKHCILLHYIIFYFILLHFKPLYSVSLSYRLFYSDILYFITKYIVLLLNIAFYNNIPSFIALCCFHLLKDINFISILRIILCFIYFYCVI